MKDNYGNRPENLTHTQYFHDLVARWRSLPDEEKQTYIDKNLLLKYKEEHTNWLSSLSPFRKDLYFLVKANNHPDVNHESTSKTTWVPAEYVELYKSLPTRPCISPNGLFVREFFAAGNRDTLSNVAQMYSSLSDMEKEVIVSKF